MQAETVSVRNLGSRITSSRTRWSLSKADELIGTLPLILSDGNTKPSSFPYGVCFRHSVR